MADFFDECNDRHISPKDFIETFCNRCRNRECTRAGWAEDRFHRRIQTQEERFFNPLRADPRTPKYMRIFESDFQDMLHRAMQLEVASQRGDWEIPEIPVLDGNSSTGTLIQTQEVDAAAQVLALARGTELRLPQVPNPASPPEPPVPMPEPQKPQAPPSKPDVSRIPVLLAGHNTPFPTGGMMVDGAPPPEPPKAADPWAAPAANKPKVVKPGAKIKLGE